MLNHAVPAVRGNQSHLDAFGILDPVFMGEAHGTGVESGNLVIVLIGGNKGLTGVTVDFLDMLATDAVFVHPLGIGRKIGTDGAHRQRIAPQQFQIVGDVPGAATELATHVGYQEGNVQNMHLIGKNMVLELVREDHNGIVGK